MKQTRLATSTVLALLLGGLPPLSAAPVDYVRQIKPLLTARCYACHGALQQKADLRLDTVKFLRAGGNSGPAIVPGSSGESLLLAHVTAVAGKRRMPPASEGEGLSAKQVSLLRDWIDQGASGPADEKPEADPKDHWAFRAPIRSALPQLSGAVRLANPVDAFLAAARQKHGLTVQPRADRRTLLRRVYLDLIGLPPTRAELQAFLSDAAPDAYERVVEKLLASPRYGERWGRHWMDVWRYSDWWGLGAEVRNSQKHIWHWRDWILSSLNADKGYDQMLREMLAADELYPNDLDQLRATGFLARQYFLFNRNSWLEETVEHTSKAFLGLTMNCAKCHDHKFDPISQVDYYRFRAFFEPYQVRSDEPPGEVDFEKDGIPRAFDCNLDAPTYRFVRGDEKQPMKDRPLKPGLPKLLSFGALDIRPVSLPPEAQLPGLRPFVLENHLREAEKQIQSARDRLAQAKKKPLTTAQERAVVVREEKALAAAEARLPALRAQAAADRARHQSSPASDSHELARKAADAERRLALACAEEGLAIAEVNLLSATAAQKAEFRKKRNAARDAVAAARKALVSPDETYTSLRGSLKTRESNMETEASRGRPFPATSSGRRSALAAWLTDRRHPLTARVAVNHVWARHFGAPLVANVFDFGRKGAAPTHPRLLDWLAIDLMDNGWSLKHLHRLLVTSEAYRLTSSSAGASAANRANDAENRYYWRMNAARMQSEVLRDSLLHLAGELDTTMGGPPLDPLREEASRRRSLYFFHSHNESHRFLSMFDDASVLECYRRAESIVPQQALALSNSRLTLDMTARINTRLHEILGYCSDAAFVCAAFETVLSAAPTAAEQGECEQTLARLTALLKKQGRPDAARRARGDLIQALVNHNDFITIR